MFSVAGRMLEDQVFPNLMIKEGLTMMARDIHLNVVDVCADFLIQLKRKVY